MYCPHTPRNLLRDSGRTGCIARVRCRTGCTSLWCPPSGVKADACECLNETCAVFGASNSSKGKGGKTAVLGPGGLTPAARAIQLRFWRSASGPTGLDSSWCVDVTDETPQLFHAADTPCLSRGDLATLEEPPPRSAASLLAVRGIRDDGRRARLKGQTSALQMRLAMGGTRNTRRLENRLEMNLSDFFGGAAVPTGLQARCLFPSAAVRAMPNLTTRWQRCQTTRNPEFLGRGGRFQWLHQKD